MDYNKPPLSISDLIGLLEKRGLGIPDHQKAKHYLSNISYYRLTAYMLPFQQTGTEHLFQERVTFDDILDLYIFDRELRIQIMDVIERIEVALRAQIIHQFSIHNGSHFFEDVSLYRNQIKFTEHLSQLDGEINRSPEVFINHYQTQYNSPQRPPAWMSLEVSSMGLLSKIFKNLKRNDAKKQVISHFGLWHPQVLESWMHCITYVRNLCAHHSRIWNRNLTLTPTFPNRTHYSWLQNPDINKKKLYAFLSCMIYLLKIITPRTHFPDNFTKLIQGHPNIPLHSMGFPSDWEYEELWKSPHR